MKTSTRNRTRRISVAIAAPLRHHDNHRSLRRLSLQSLSRRGPRTAREATYDINCLDHGLFPGCAGNLCCPADYDVLVISASSNNGVWRGAL